jgi:hypothetical protein
MAREKILRDAIVADVASGLDKPSEYVRHILANLWDCKGKHGNATVRIGVTGVGISPHYRIDYLCELPEIGKMEVNFGAFDGRNHKVIRVIEEASVAKDESVLMKEHWSERSNTLDEIAALLGELRNFKRKVRSTPPT